MAYILSIGYTDKGKPMEVVIGDCLWDKYKILSVLEATTYRFKNAGITEKLSLIGTQGDLDKYTAYYIHNKRIIRKAYTVLAVGDNNRYLVSDGITNPKWMDFKDINTKINEYKYLLSNSRVQDDKLIPVAGKFQHLKEEEEHGA